MRSLEAFARNYFRLTSFNFSPTTSHRARKSGFSVEKKCRGRAEKKTEGEREKKKERGRDKVQSVRLPTDKMVNPEVLPLSRFRSRAAAWVCGT